VGELDGAEKVDCASSAGGADSDYARHFECFYSYATFTQDKWKKYDWSLHYASTGAAALL
jgi:hypothetical protein